MRVSGGTQVFGILGDPVAHSLSPLMQNAAFAAMGLNAVYVPFHVSPADLAGAVAGLRSLGIRGANVTVPHKEAVCSFLDRIDPAALRVGAVNTLCREGEALVGYNTDGTGFLRALKEDLQFDPAGRRILLLGAGGACRAALEVLAAAGATWVGVANRTEGRAAGLCEQFAHLHPGTSFAHFPLRTGELDRVAGRIDLLVNTSAVGLKGEVFEEIPWNVLSPSVPVYDMVYSRTTGGTPLLQTARIRGHRGADGLGMLAGQGEEAFFLWTGQRPPAGLMRKTLTDALTSP
jgi:shikimate dehydrogenase